MSRKPVLRKWEPIGSAHDVRETVVQLYRVFSENKEAGELCRGTLISWLIDHRNEKHRDKLGAISLKEALELQPLTRALNGSSPLDSNQALQLAQATLLGHPLQAGLEAECKEELGFLNALIEKMPAKASLVGGKDQEWRTTFNAVMRCNKVQVDGWDAAIEFLAADSATDIFFISWDSGFQVGEMFRSTPNLQAAALGALRRGAFLSFVVPRESRGLASATSFSEVAKTEGCKRSSVRIITPDMLQSRKGTKDKPKFTKELFFCPGLRFVLFFDRGNDAVLSRSVIFIGLPPRATNELFAFEFTDDEREEGKVLETAEEWFRHFIPRKFRRFRFPDELC